MTAVGAENLGSWRTSSLENPRGRRKSRKGAASAIPAAGRQSFYSHANRGWHDISMDHCAREMQTEHGASVIDQVEFDYRPRR